jgi:exodeoxyribonuclease-3
MSAAVPARRSAKAPVKSALPQPAKNLVKDSRQAPYAVKAVPAAPAGALRIATWNINSVRLRIDLVKKLAEKASPDVICLQETKSPDEHFPREAIAAMGYTHQAMCGMKGYNGVAILSRRPLHNASPREWYGKADCRHIHAEIEAGGERIEIHNLYVPAGGDIPDPRTNPKFDHKLGFLREQIAWWGKQDKKGPQRILVGDLNIAPYETDVWSHKQLLKIVSHTPVETDLLGQLLGAHDWIDAPRHLVPEPTHMYTWWSYRNQDWKASDRGRRLDHVWVTSGLKSSVAGTHIFKGTRDWRQTSDHVPVIVDLKL